MNLTRLLLDPVVYDKTVRPARIHTDVTNISFDLSLAQLIDVDEKNQIITTNQWLTMSWFDPKLIWNPSDWDNVSLLHIKYDKIWLPDIVLYNNADNLASLSQISTNVMVSFEGTVTWLSTGIFKSSCPIDVRYFPFDEQNCTLKFASWTYDSARIDLSQKTNTGDLSNFMANSEWEIIGLHVKKNIVKYSCCPETFPDLTYVVQMRRRPLFYVFNMILPCFLITTVAFLGFCVPSDSGEKVSIGVTTLLSMTVFLMLVTDSMPPNSDSLPLIGIYYFSAIIIVSIATAMSVASLNLYHRGKHHLHPVPKWIGRLFFIIIPKLLFMNIDLPVQLQNQSESFLKCMTTKTSVTSEKSETRKKLTHKSDTKNKNALLHNGKITLYEDPVDRNTTSSLTFSDKLNSYDFYTSPPLILRSYPPIQTSNTLSNRQSHKPHDKDNQNCLTDLTNKNTNATKLSMDYIHRLVEQNESRYEQQEHNRSIGQEWQILGRVVDRLLVFIFLITTMVVFIFIFCQAPHLRLK
ncbi:unnamed protein product [Rotaria magnacalcarata]|nr:unnamed protein product [Rotaria magnacalcarata]CAF1557551.1 unnamed protein product [Rotaria magnacalcarata]CAF2190464.1 unnamed protein product [Rotaria magnacalcarata]CAF3874275.1 unnamed protein product [Rotaria magnacalcarata]CAF3959035.1 unnamed protein product [Rotaria magnacalcarata]